MRFSMSSQLFATAATAGLDLTQRRIAKYLDLCERLQGMPRHLSQHSGGMVICQGRLDSVVPLEPATMPGTAKGLIFVTLEDETGNANVIVMPDIYEKYRQAVLEPKFVRVSGTVQNQDGIVHLRAEQIAPLEISAAEVSSHDFR